MHETIIRQLSKPHGLAPQATVLLDGCKLQLRAYGPAHWAALQYVERLIRHAGFWEYEDQGDNRIDSIRARCLPLSCCSASRVRHGASTLMQIYEYMSTRRSYCLVKLSMYFMSRPMPWALSPRWNHVSAIKRARKNIIWWLKTTLCIAEPSR